MSLLKIISYLIPSVYHHHTIYNIFSKFYLDQSYIKNFNWLIPNDANSSFFIELACGTCFYSKRIFKNCKKFIGYDVNNTFIQYLNRKHSNEKIMFKTLDLNNEFPKEISDYSIMFDALYHFKNNKLLSSEDLLKLMILNSKKGVMIIEGIRNKFNPNSFLLKHILAQFKNPGTEPQYYSFKKEELLEILDKIKCNYDFKSDDNFAYIKISK